MVSKWLGVRDSGICGKFIVLTVMGATIHDGLSLYHEGSVGLVIKLGSVLCEK